MPASFQSIYSSDISIQWLSNKIIHSSNTQKGCVCMYTVKWIMILFLRKCGNNRFWNVMVVGQSAARLFNSSSSLFEAISLSNRLVHSRQSPCHAKRGEYWCADNHEVSLIVIFNVALMIQKQTENYPPGRLYIGWRNNELLNAISPKHLLLIKHFKNVLSRWGMLKFIGRPDRDRWIPRKERIPSVCTEKTFPVRKVQVLI